MSLASLSSLLKQSHINDHEQLLQAANAALKANKHDIEAQHIKAIALLKLDRYEDAVRLIETGDAKLKEKAKLEYAYALYKHGRQKEAAEIADGSVDRGLQHVHAQALYGVEDFLGCANSYSTLSEDLQGDNEADLRTNRGAIDAQLEWAQQGQHVKNRKPAREDLEAYETAYNAACASIGRGELGQAEILLKRAKDICSSLEDLSESEKESEMLPITVQQVYVLARLGKVDEAAQLSQTIDASKISDTASKQIAEITKVACDSSNNPFLVERILTSDKKPDATHKLFAFQSSILDRNRYAIDLQTLKFDGVASKTQASLAKSPSAALDANTGNLSVFSAAAHAHNQTGKAAIKHILPLLQKRPNDVGLILTIVQLYVLAKNSNAAISLLQSFLTRLEQSGTSKDLSVRYSPTLVGTIVSLYTSQRRRQQARQELSKAASHWRSEKHSGSRDKGIIHLLKSAGSVLVESDDAGDQKLAAGIFSDLHNDDKEDKYAAAGLVATSTSEDPVETSSLISLDRLIGSIDAEALENAGVAQRAAPASQTQSRKRAAAEAPATKPKKIRKTKMPKDYDPAKKPDPERWLPLRDRSSYRPKGKKGKARQAMLSQGAVSNEADSSRPATPGTDTIKGKTPAGSNANKKKKKAKK